MIRTERLLLVPVTPDHVVELVELYADPVVAHWYGGAWTEDQARTWAAEQSKAWRHVGVGKWMAYRRDDGALVGRGGLSWMDLQGRRRLELGWALLTAHRGRGYATEIGRAGLDFAFDALDVGEVVAFTEIHNHASRAVMERLGMTEVAIIRYPGLVEGRTGVHEDAPFALYRLERSSSPPAGPNRAER